MNKKLILHIGTEKTGTTSIQEFLYENNEALKDRGVFFPLSPCGSNKFPNHRKLATACFDDGHVDDSFSSLRLSDFEFSNWSESILKEIKDELKSSDCSVHILSSEHFSSRLKSIDEINRLHTFLSEIYSEIEVLVYFRRQDQYVVSSYSTLLKSGGTSSKILPSKIDETVLNYYLMCEKWSSIFGESSMNVRIFDRSKLIDSNIISDFMGFIGLDLEGLITPEKESNPSISPIAQQALININKLYKKSVISENTRYEFIDFLERNYAGTPRMPQKDYVINWFEKFSHSNSVFFKKYLSGSNFDSNFNGYPKRWVEHEFSEEIMARMLFQFFEENN